MILAHPTSPRAVLAARLDGELMGRDSILVGGHVIWASVAGVVRMDGGHLLGAWSDGVDALVAAYEKAVAA